MFFFFFSLLFFVGCTQDLGLKNIALRHVILQFDDQLVKMPDQDAAKKIKAKTKIEVVSLEKQSDAQATVVVKINTFFSENASGGGSRDVVVHLEKKGDWAVIAD